jgi:hypothetical protein
MKEMYYKTESGTEAEKKENRAKKELLRKDLQQKLGVLFEKIMPPVNEKLDLLPRLDTDGNLLEKTFRVDKDYVDRGTFEDIFTDDVCDILFNKNIDSKFSVTIIKNKDEAEENFYLTITAATVDDISEYKSAYHNPKKTQTRQTMPEEARAILIPTKDLDKPFFFLTTRASIGYVTKYIAKNPNEEKALALGIIELTETLAAKKGLII